MYMTFSATENEMRWHSLATTVCVPNAFHLDVIRTKLNPVHRLCNFNKLLPQNLELLVAC